MPLTISVYRKGKYHFRRESLNMRNITILLIISTICIMIFIHNYRKIQVMFHGFTKRKFIRFVGVFIIVVSALAFIFGYRITPSAASRANSFIEKDFVLMDDLDLDWAYIHFYHDKINDMYYTTISEKKCFMYVSRVSVWLYGNKEDPIRTIGSMSCNNGGGKSANLLMVESDDENIDAIIINQQSNIIETKINIADPQIIVIDDFSNWDSCDVIAVDKFGEEMYYYGYPKDKNILKGEDYRWHKVKVFSDGQ